LRGSKWGRVKGTTGRKNQYDPAISEPKSWGYCQKGRWGGEKGGAYGTIKKKRCGAGGGSTPDQTILK